MKIESIDLIPIRSTREMGRRSPSDPEKSISRHIIVQLHTDARITGLGEMSDLNWELTPQVVDNLKKRLETQLIGRSPLDLNTIHQSLSAQEWKHQVLCGVDIALHDAVGKALDVPLYRLFGGKCRDRIPFAYPLAPCQSQADIDANLGRVERLLAQGHPTIRYYFGADLDADERFLSELRRRWGDQVEINALDASGRFTVETAIQVIRRFAVFKPNLFESPVQGRHRAPVEDFVAVRQVVDVPISEHVGEYSVAASLARHQGVDVFNLGVGNAGFIPCRKLFGLAEVFGISALMGSTVELSIGTAARAHLAVSIPNLTFPCYMSGPLVYQEQIVAEKVRYAEGHIIVPEGPGLGLELDPEKLAAQRLW